MIRVWKVKVWQPDVTEIQNECDLCNTDLYQECRDCTKIGKRTMLKWCRDLLTILLCGQKRKSSPLSLLDVNLISFIYGICIDRETMGTKCYIKHLHCNHMFHHSCYNEWKMHHHRRGATYESKYECPTCDNKSSCNVRVVNIERATWASKHRWHQSDHHQKIKEGVGLKRTL